MKRFATMLLCVCAVVFTACNDDKTEDTNKWFKQPQVGTVTGTMATITCPTSFGEGALASGTAGFAYAPLEGPGAGEYRMASDVTVSGTVITCRLSGLNPETYYIGFAFVQMGPEQLKSAPVTFETGKMGEEDRETPTFGTPTSSGVTTNSATVGCSFDYAGDESVTEVYFAYNTAGGTEKRAAVSVQAGAKSASLTGLTASTAYTFSLRVVVGGQTYASDPASFTTTAAGEVVPTFGTPTSSGVTDNSATVSCTFAYTGDKTVTEAYFAYNIAGGTEQRATVSVQPGTKSASLTGLTASTTYTFSLRVTIDGKPYSSTPATFMTTSGGVTPPGGSTKYSGWAELPGEVSRPNDYYYAYHMRDDAKSIRNYSVCYSADMRCAVWVAYPLHACYDGSAGRNDSWKKDPIILSSVQPNLTSGSYVSGYSRGHMIASSDRQVSVSTNKQTFYVTNMAPQLQDRFNGGIWNSLEQKCWNNICSDTLFMVTGAHFANTNTTVKDQSGNRVVVPTHFYKVLIRSKNGNTKKPLWELPADQIKCVGFWFEHKNYSGATPSQYMTSVAEIEQQIGFTLFPNVPQAPKSTFNKGDWSF